ncbi:MAG: methyltransferase [Bacteroidetes bacterium HGW-Bacteroidetes-2]|jgi:predicted O-methyltransferase YrrM|nr:MAG: methyltransferase [Bacteroidetes bacterium HGW-Bacteroidetes-2]
MEFISQKLDDYVVNHTQEEPKLLQELNRETCAKVLQPRMLSGHYQGRILSMISKIIHPNNILEIGTYTGYSALCLMEGIQQDGQLHTMDINEELHDLQRKYFEKSGLGGQIFQYTGNALDIIPKLNLHFDLVFIDADKENYTNYFELILPKMKRGGIILSDNVLWSGKVLEKVKKDDRDTTALIAYNKLLHSHPKVETIVLPIRDGLSICRVK